MNASRLLAVAAASALTLLSTVGASAGSLVQISFDTLNNPTSQHATEVEPDTFSFGTTIVSAFQVGRFFSGGASDIGFATTTNNGATWQDGLLPGITVFVGNGPYDRVSDAAVAYDPAHKVWLISTLAILETPSVHGAAVLVSRSTDGLNWDPPITVATANDTDKNWIVCDTWSASKFYGNCYVEWDDHSQFNRLKMNTSTDGGLTWGPSLETANHATGIGGQPVVQPSGTVVVPIDNANATVLLSFISSDGGASWSATVVVTTIVRHTVAGSLRSLPLPTAEVDGAGTVYVAWQDARFEAGQANDIVFVSTQDGLTYTPVTRVPLDDIGSGVDHFIPGLAVDPATSGNTAALGLTYYYYPVAACTVDTCELNVGFSKSADGGATWTVPMQLAGPMNNTWLANTSQGYMAGDYISTSWAGGFAFPVIAVANPPSAGVFDEAMYSWASGLSAARGAAAVRRADRPAVNGKSDFVATTALTQR